MSNWTDICQVDDILPNAGRAALFNGQQVAIFRICDNDGERFFAVDNYCPFAHANVLARGIVGSIGEELVVASPIYKQHFSLSDGHCLEDDSQSLRTWSVQRDGDTLQLTA